MYAKIGQYAKGVVVIGTAVMTSLLPYYGSRPWFIGVAAGIGAIQVILVPNQAKAQ